MVGATRWIPDEHDPQMRLRCIDGCRHEVRAHRDVVGHAAHAGRRKRTVRIDQAHVRITNNGAESSSSSSSPSASSSRSPRLSRSLPSMSRTTCELASARLRRMWACRRLQIQTDAQAGALGGNQTGGVVVSQVFKMRRVVRGRTARQRRENEARGRGRGGGGGGRGDTHEMSAKTTESMKAT